MKIIFLFLAVLAVDSSVIGIDFGTDWLKVSIVKPGIPLDIVLNKETKRKTPAVLAIINGMRIFGNDAIQKSTRFPQQTYHNLKSLIGKPFNSDNTRAYKSQFDNHLVDKDGLIFFENDLKVFSLAHLVAMELLFAKRQAESFGNETVNGVVLTVPPYYTHFERQAVLDAADIANLRVLNLINDETAVALNYAMLRQFSNDTVQNHIFLDIGAGSTVASLITFKNVNVTVPSPKNSKLKQKIKVVPQIEVKAVGWDENLGGNELDLAVKEILSNSFIESQKGKINIHEFQNDNRAQAKLLKEANRVKQVLSANQEAYSSVEGLFLEKDFKTMISRKDLEEKVKHLFDGFLKPIKFCLETSDLKIKDIDSVVLVGGSVRVPIIQESLAKLVGEEKIARNVNGDEAAVLGAGFRAAGISTMFRVREIAVKDKNEFPIQVTYKSEEDSQKDTKTEIFNSKSFYGTKKLMNFKKNTDFSFQLEYSLSKMPILSASIIGISEALTTIAEKKKTILKGPIIKAVIYLSESGLVSVEEVFVYAELGKSVSGSIKDGIMSFFGKKSEDGVELESEDVVDNGGEGVVPSPVVAKEEAEKPKKDEKAKDETVKDQVIIEKIPLNFTIKFESFLPLSESEKQEIKNRIKLMDEEDEEIQKREEALNTFEALTYQIKYSLEDTDMISVSTPADRSTLAVLVETSQDWLENDHSLTKVEVINAKKNELKVVYDPIGLRRVELEKRPEAFINFRKLLEATKEVFEETLKNQTSLIEEKKEAKFLTIYSQDEIDAFKVLIANYSKWVDDKEVEQGKLALIEPPVILAEDINKKAVILGRKFEKFLNSKRWNRVREDDKKEETAEEGATVPETGSSKVGEETGVAGDEENKKGAEEDSGGDAEESPIVSSVKDEL